MKTIKLTATTLLAGIIAGAGTITVSAQSPKIVVGIMVDQLRGDYIEQLRPYFGPKGFNRLIADGAYIRDVDFRGTVSDAPSGTAVVYTGAWPVANGVASEEVFDPVQKRNVPLLVADPQKIKPDYSPANLRLSTIADELFINGGRLSKIYSVAGNPQVAVVTAGHAGNSAIFFDEATGKWSVPAYYGTLPAFIGNKYRTSPLSAKISSTTWRPLQSSSLYPYGGERAVDFSYSFAGASRDTYSRFKSSAPFNAEVTDVALELIKSMQTSSVAGGQPGMVNIEYSLAPVTFDSDGDSRPELVDSYMRLDNELGRLLEAIDRSFGKENAVVFLSSTGYATEPEIPEADAKIPTGEITLLKAESLLNSYLSAQYGNGDFVTAIKGGRLYLDSKAIEKKNLDISKIRNEAKDFLLRMGGVSEAFTIDEVLHSDSRRASDIALGVDAKSAPDLFIFFTPGWTVTDDTSYPSVSKKVRLSAPPTPAFIMAPGVAPQEITVPVEATAIAPTVTTAINIRAPNGAATKPLSLKKKNSD